LSIAPLKHNFRSDAFRACGAPSRANVDARTREPAALAGRVPPQVTRRGYEQANREVTGESDGDRQIAVLDGFEIAP